MKKNISNNLVLLKDYTFPFCIKKDVYKRYSVILAVGGNIGNCKIRFKKLIKKVRESKKIIITKISPILINPPTGYLLQPNFFNFVLVAKTDLTAKRLLHYIQYLENRFKRKRVIKDGPRTLDIDIIVFNKMKIDNQSLTIPHKHWKKRVFVVLPIKLL